MQPFMSLPLSKESQSLGYRFPAEWEPQEAIWFAWPTRKDLWKGVLGRVRKQLAELYVLASRFQAVRILCPAFAQKELKLLMAEAGDVSNVEFYDYQTDDVWIRDYGPLFLLNENGTETVIVDWNFNAWGNKVPLRDRNNAATAWISSRLGIRRLEMNSVLEGGAVESNGSGALLTSEAVLLNPNRNGSVTVVEVNRKLAEGLAIDQVFWLKDGLVGDDTDGHVDNLARFFKVDAILTVAVPKPETPNAPALEENARRIREFSTKDGQPYEVLYMPLPDPIYLRGELLPASYMNYLVLNEAVLVPTYNQLEKDTQAIEILSKCFPDREVIGFDCRDILQEGGAIHCMSQHQPSIRQKVEL